MNDDVTERVAFGDVDGELLPLIRCVCGAKHDSWSVILSIYESGPAGATEVPCCGRRFYFRNTIRVYEAK